ncbi:MAG: hypothetical protein V4671_16965 [Armatimonadota bacterium]
MRYLVGISTGIGVVVLLTALVHAVVWPQLFHSGLYFLIYLFVVPVAAALGITTQIASDLLRQGHPDIASRYCTVGGSLNIVLQLLLSWLYVSGSENPMPDSFDALITLFLITLLWATALVTVGFALSSKG